jgi:hypothetical protein
MKNCIRQVGEHLPKKDANAYPEPFLPVDETFDVGVDTRTSVDEKDYQVPFRFNGKIDKLTFDLGPMQLSDEDENKMRDAISRGKD